MTITINSVSLKKQLDASNPQVLADMLRQAQIGSALRAMTTHRRRLNMVTQPANPFVLATVQSLILPDDAKACTILRATATAGAGTPGELINDGYAAAAPAAGHISIQPNGDIATLIADGWTSLDVVYMPEKHDTVELTLAVVPGTGVCTLPTSVGQLCAAGVILLMEAEALAGGSVAKKITLVPAAGAPAAGRAQLNLAKTTVTFAVADAVTQARLKLALKELAKRHGLVASFIAKWDMAQSGSSGHLHQSLTRDGRNAFWGGEMDTLSETGRHFLGGLIACARELSAFLNEQLPGHMVPVQFVVLDALPLTTNGKIDRAALPPPAAVAASGEGGAPQTQTQQAIAAMWQELLKTDGIGIRDDFFDLGGDSMTATVLVAGLADRFGITMRLASLFEDPTIAGLAEAVDLHAVMRSGPATSGHEEREEFTV